LVREERVSFFSRYATTSPILEEGRSTLTHLPPLPIRARTHYHRSKGYGSGGTRSRKRKHWAWWGGA
jgi:hypothetical protein